MIIYSTFVQFVILYYSHNMTERYCDITDKNFPVNAADTTPDRIIILKNLFKSSPKNYDPIEAPKRETWSRANRRAVVNFCKISDAMLASGGIVSPICSWVTSLPFIFPLREYWYKMTREVESEKGSLKSIITNPHEKNKVLSCKWCESARLLSTLNAEWLDFAEKIVSFSDTNLFFHIWF